MNTLSVIENDEGKEVFEELQIVSVIAAYFRDIFSTVGDGDFSEIQNILSPQVTEEMNRSTE